MCAELHVTKYSLSPQKREGVVKTQAGSSLIHFHSVVIFCQKDNSINLSPSLAPDCHAIHSCCHVVVGIR